MLQKIRNSLGYRYTRYQYKNFANTALRPSFNYEQLKGDGFYSQCGQDKWINDCFFNEKIDGVFIDIGAHDGVSFSNSYYFEKKGWTGLAVEPMPETYKLLSESRQCTTVNACVTKKTGKCDFRVLEGYSQMLSGVVDEYDSRHLERIQREIGRHGGGYTDISVDGINFNELVASNKITHVDYLSIDVEGAELGILQSIDFEKVDISVIGVENNYEDYQIPKTLRKKGYKLHSIVGDEIYIKNS